MDNDEFEIDLDEIEKEVEGKEETALKEKKEDDEGGLGEDEKEKEGTGKEETSSDDNDEESEEISEDERKQFGQRAQKRIRKLIKDKRALEDSVLERENKLKELEDKLEAQRGASTQTEDFAAKQYEERIDAETSSIEQQWKEAYEEGDQTKLFKIQQRLAQVELARRDLADWKRGRKPAEKVESKQIGNVQVDRQQSGRQEQKPQGPSQKALDWHKKNQWFGPVVPATGLVNPNYDEDLTSTAAEVHKELSEEGVVVDSEQYYNELNKRVREIYPEKFTSQRKTMPINSGKLNEGNTRKVKLTKEEVARCERMGIDLKRYAAEKAKLTQRQG